MPILDTKLPDEILHTYPCPLAIAAARVNDSTESVEKFLALARLAGYFRAAALLASLAARASASPAASRAPSRTFS